MAKTKGRSGVKDSPVSVNQLPLLQDRLVLNRYFCSLFGFQNFRELRNVLRDQQEGWAENGHSYFFRLLEGLQGLKLAPDQLAAYDLRIKGYVEKLNRFRTPPIQLKYFQYLAVLFTEIYLDRLFGNRATLLSELNHFVGQEKGKLSPATLRYQPFTEADLSKLAFWMATGSGKTLVMHINLWQCLHYCQ
ncbi:MAG: hypothetical protein ACUVQZ_03695, partial [Candidatus Caldatribacteriaceae bacterium]